MWRAPRGAPSRTAVAEEIDLTKTGKISFYDYAFSMTGVDLEDGMFPAELKEALKVADGTVPWPKRTQPLARPTSALPFPEPPHSVRGGFNNSRRPTTSWGGAHGVELVPSEQAAAPTAAEAEARQSFRARKAREREEAKLRAEVRKVIEALRQHATTAGSVSSAFRKHDAFVGDRSSTISKEEFEASLAKLNLTVSPAAMEQVIAEFDEDGNKEIEFREFVHRLVGRRACPTRRARARTHPERPDELAPARAAAEEPSLRVTWPQARVEGAVGARRRRRFRLRRRADDRRAAAQAGGRGGSSSVERSREAGGGGDARAAARAAAAKALEPALGLHLCRRRQGQPGLLCGV